MSVDIASTTSAAQAAIDAVKAFNNQIVQLSSQCDAQIGTLTAAETQLQTDLNTAVNALQTQFQTDSATLAAQITAVKAAKASLPVLPPPAA